MLSLICNAPDIALFVPVSNVDVPTPTAFTYAVTVPLSPGPTSPIVLDVIVLSEFLVYPLPADGAEPPVLFVGVNP